MFSYKRLETMRQTRLWITEVIIPVAGMIVLVATNDAAREAVKDTWNKSKKWTKKQTQKIKDRFTKKERQF